MADGLNHVRALRIGEIMNDFTNIQTYIAAIRANPSAEEYNEEGYILLRNCVTEAQALLAQRFQAQPVNQNDPEQARTQLRRIITDAAARRFQAQRIYFRAAAALRWVNGRAAVLQGQRPHAGHARALLTLREALRAEVASITDARVELSLRQADTSAHRWLDEDPPLAVIQRVISSR